MADESVAVDGITEFNARRILIFKVFFFFLSSHPSQLQSSPLSLFLRLVVPKDAESD